MTRLISLTAVLCLSASIAAADKNPPDAGAKGTITIWDEAGLVVLEHRYCVRTGATWDYVTCGKILRDRFKLHTCTENAAGTTHKYLYQVGDSKPVKSQLYCKK